MGCVSSQTDKRKEREPTSQQKVTNQVPSLNNQRNIASITSYPQIVLNPQVSQQRNFGNRDSQRRQNFLVYRSQLVQIPQIQQRNNIEQRSQYASQISQTLSQIERNRRERMDSRQDQISQEQQINNLEILYFLFMALNRRDNQRSLYPGENFMLLLRLLQILGSQPDSNGLTQEQIKNLVIKTAESSEQLCSVCQQNFVIGQKITLLDCNHQYHPDCIIPWLQKSSKCPLCRKSCRREQ